MNLVAIVFASLLAYGEGFSATPTVTLTPEVDTKAAFEEAKKNSYHSAVAVSA